MVLIHNLENEVFLSGKGSIASKFLKSMDDKGGESKQCTINHKGLISLSFFSTKICWHLYFAQLSMEHPLAFAITAIYTQYVEG